MGISSSGACSTTTAAPGHSMVSACRHLHVVISSPTLADICFRGIPLEVLMEAAEVSRCMMSLLSSVLSFLLSVHSFD